MRDVAHDVAVEEATGLLREAVRPLETGSAASTPERASACRSPSRTSRPTPMAMGTPRRSRFWRSTSPASARRRRRARCRASLPGRRRGSCLLFLRGERLERRAVGADDLRSGVAAFELRFRGVGGAFDAAEEEERHAGLGGGLAQRPEEIAAGDALLQRRASELGEPDHGGAVGHDQIGGVVRGLELAILCRNREVIEVTGADEARSIAQLRELHDAGGRLGHRDVVEEEGRRCRCGSAEAFAGQDTWMIRSARASERHGQIHGTGTCLTPEPGFVGVNAPAPMWHSPCVQWRMAKLAARTLLTRGAVLVALFAGVVACSGSNDPYDDDDDSSEDADGEDSYEATDDALTVRGPVLRQGDRPRGAVCEGQGRSRAQLLPEPQGSRARSAREPLREPLHRLGRMRPSHRRVHELAAYLLSRRRSRGGRRAALARVAPRLRPREDDRAAPESLRPRELTRALLQYERVDLRLERLDDRGARSSRGRRRTDPSTEPGSRTR